MVLVGSAIGLSVSQHTIKDWNSGNADIMMMVMVLLQ